MTKATMAEILKKPVYTGVLKYGDNFVDLTEVYNFVPAVSVDDFNKINNISNIEKAITASRNEKDDVIANLLRGKVYCGDCGNPRTCSITHKELSSGKEKHYFYYRCETSTCNFSGKATRGNTVVDFVKELISSNPLSNKEAYRRYKKDMKDIQKENREKLKSKKRSLKQRRKGTKKKLEDTKEFVKRRGRFSNKKRA